MKRSRFSEEQIAYVLRLAESGTPVVDVCRQIGEFATSSASMRLVMLAGEQHNQPGNCNSRKQECLVVLLCKARGNSHLMPQAPAGRLVSLAT